ncbi:MAG TPA: hypothetical protein VKB19_04255 [Pedobacter sp.]|nr:hypothetical protein [Pedobacter sp.]
MNWLPFLAWLGLAYFIYYLLLILVDSRASGSHSSEDELPVLTFSEARPPEKVMLEDLVVDSGSVSAPAVYPEPAAKGLGGVSLANLFELSRNEAIEYTRAVSF